MPADYVYVDGISIGDIDDFVLRDRQHLAADGLVVFVVALDRHTGRLARTPEVMSHGFAGTEDAASLMDGVRDLLQSELGNEGRATDLRTLHDSLKDDVGGYLHRKTRRRPLVIPVMLEV